MIEYGINTKGAGLHVFEPVTLGFPSREYMGKTEFTGTTIGKDAVPGRAQSSTAMSPSGIGSRPGTMS